MNHPNSRAARLAAVAVAAALVQAPAQATVWTEWGDVASGSYITFDDWGYTGPGGAQANQFVVPGTSGFDPSSVGQVQKVVTLGPDWNTPDAPFDFKSDYSPRISYLNANVDSTTNFYQWGYTSPAGSTFNNMKIDTAGNYYVAKDDMQFAFYDFFDYKEVGGDGSNDQLIDPTYYNFQPYAMSDAKGWCGSVLASNPAALETMAGQVTFDFGFDVFDSTGTPLSPQYVPDFVMRSYGTLTVNVPKGTYTQRYVADAVVNNTSPTAGRDAANPLGFEDPNYYNKVSFMGGGVVPDGVWIDSNGNIMRDANGNVLTSADDGTLYDPNAYWHTNSFAGYAFLLRADGIRIIQAMDYSVYGTNGAYLVDANGNAYNYDENGNVVTIQDLSAVPVPAAVWLFGSGLLGLVGVARRKAGSRH